MRNQHNDPRWSRGKLRQRTPPPEFSETAGEDIPRILWRRKWVILASIVLALGIGYMYYSEAARIYLSRAQVLLIKKDNRLSGNDAGNRDTSTAYGIYENTLATQISLACSPLIAEKAVEWGRLANLPSFQGMHKAQIIKSIVDSLKAVQAGGAGIPDPNVMEVQYRGASPEDCLAVVSAVVRSHQDFLGSTSQNVSQETLQLIRQAKEELHQRLTEKETEYREFRRKSPLLSKGEQTTNPHESRLTDVDTARSKVLVETAQTRALLESLRNALSKGGSREAVALIAARMRIESTGSARNNSDSPEALILTAQLQEQELLETFGTGHPEVKAIRKKIELLQRQLASGPTSQDRLDRDFLTVFLQSLAEEVTVGERRLAELTRIFEDEQQRARDLAGIQIQDETLRSEIARTKLMFDDTMKRLEEVKLVKDFGGITAEVISPPALGEQVRPRLLNVMGLSLALGLVLGGAGAYLMERRDQRYRAPDDVRRQFGLPVLAEIPVLSSKGARGAARDGRMLHPVLCMYHRPGGQEAEAFRALRTTLFHGAPRGCKTLQITSPAPREGKSVIAANLAMSIARSGRKVLLMDCDLRHPDVHECLALDNVLGLSDVLAAKCDVSAALQATVVPELSAITAGTPPNNPAELLTSPRFQAMVELVRAQFDFVVLDSPPLLAVSDPAIIAPQVDAVLLVTRLTKYGRDALARSTEILGLLGIQPVGIVLNGCAQGTKYGYGDGAPRDRRASAAPRRNGQTAAPHPR